MYNFRMKRCSYCKILVKLTKHQAQKIFMYNFRMKRCSYCKILVKLTPAYLAKMILLSHMNEHVLNFTNILCVAFSFGSFAHSFFTYILGVYFFGARIAKAALKMLVKMTHDLPIERSEGFLEKISLNSCPGCWGCP
jgi:hypothetical protein